MPARAAEGQIPLPLRREHSVREYVEQEEPIEDRDGSADALQRSTVASPQLAPNGCALLARHPSERNETCAAEDDNGKDRMAHGHENDERSDGRKAAEHLGKVFA